MMSRPPAAWARAASSGASTALICTPKRFFDGSSGGLCLVQFAPGDRHVRAFERQHGRDTHADRPGATQHNGAFAGQWRILGKQRHAGSGRRIGAVAVQHDGNAKSAVKLGTHGVQQRFAGGHAGTAQEQCGEALFLGTAREDGALDETANAVRRYVGMPDHVIRAAVHSRLRYQTRWGARPCPAGTRALLSFPGVYPLLKGRKSSFLKKRSKRLLCGCRGSIRHRPPYK